MFLFHLIFFLNILSLRANSKRAPWTFNLVFRSFALRLNIASCQAKLAFDDLKLHGCTRFKSTITLPRNGSKVEEDILSLIWCNRPSTHIGIKRAPRPASLADH